jgi:signal peptidase I
MPHRSNLAREYFEALLIAVVLAAFARTFVVQAFKIPTPSMAENLLIGDHILVNKFIYAPTPDGALGRWLPGRGVRRGDVVVFKYPEDPTRDFIKRCVALPGDTVEIREKRLHVNGDLVADEGYTYHTDERTYPNSPFLHASFRQRDSFGPYDVPNGHYFCLGDNRDNSHDSRFWGPVPAEYVKGRALLVYWSRDPASEPAAAAVGLGARLARTAALPLRFVHQTRWNRSFLLVR